MNRNVSPPFNEKNNSNNNNNNDNLWLFLLTLIYVFHLNIILNVFLEKFFIICCYLFIGYELIIFLYLFQSRVHIYLREHQPTYVYDLVVMVSCLVYHCLDHAIEVHLVANFHHGLQIHPYSEKEKKKIKKKKIIIFNINSTKVNSNC